jgi:hypothetical protein
MVFRYAGGVSEPTPGMVPPGHVSAGLRSSPEAPQFSAHAASIGDQVAEPSGLMVSISRGPADGAGVAVAGTAAGAGAG